jgi:hypothetical protein
MMNGEKIMSEHVWCHGPNCHTNHTLDRVRGSKGAKVLRTRKIKLHPEYINMYSYFCSNQCYNDFANANIEQIIAIAPRREPLETPIDRDKRSKHEKDHGLDILGQKQDILINIGATILTMVHGSGIWYHAPINQKEKYEYRNSKST